MTELHGFCKKVMRVFLNNPVASRAPAPALSIEGYRIGHNRVSIEKSLVFWNGILRLINLGIRRNGTLDNIGMRGGREAAARD